MKQVCILLVLVCFSWHASAQFSLRGTVTGADNELLTGAHVIISNSYYQTTTDKNGSFIFQGIKPGIYQLKITYVGYEGYEQAVEVKDNTTLAIALSFTATMSEAVIVSAVRASQNTPTTFSIINKEEISRKNTAQDLPYLLSFEPSVVVTSDAGAGVGYTGLRIRGSDITRINVTINGVPLNDPESHSVYWVDIPDFACSVNSLQLQRGVGSSTNGAGAFGASMNLETNSFQSKPFGILSLGAGSFNTWKTSFQAGTGLIKDHWYFEGRGSAVGSEGYIDRASSELSSFFMQGGYYGDKTLVKAVVFGGREKTYQAWYGIDEYKMETDRTFNWAGVIYNKDNTMSYYDNQTDNYRQDHYQVHISHQFTDALVVNLSGHYTLGKGYYEEYQQADDFADYGLPPQLFGRDSILNGAAYEYFYHDTITASDIIRRRWLDNRFYGATWSVRYRKEKIDLVVGGALNKYDRARHFGEIIWSEYAVNIPKDYEYYNNTAFKTDFNVFAKAAWSPVEDLTIYGDLQIRTINYKDHGIESHLNPVAIDETFHFLNPKAGVSYNTRAGTLYASYGIGHREPIRDDFIDAVEGEKPRPETLGDLEIGMRNTTDKVRYAINYFLMNYRDQLVLTGAINDDGAYIRKNSGSSYRTGVELSGSYKPVRFVEIAANLSLSTNKTDYKLMNAEGEIISYDNTTISFSPSVVGGGQLRLFPFRNLEIDWLMKYVGKQYLDNTSNDDLALDPYLLNDARLAYLINPEKAPAMEFTLSIYNIFNERYESNGYSYDNYAYYYPQAGINFIAGCNIKF
jgi:iron complex outermembrane receptor protein